MTFDLLGSRIGSVWNRRAAASRGQENSSERAFSSLKSFR
jgi:hypothetical protein